MSFLFCYHILIYSNNNSLSILHFFRFFLISDLIYSLLSHSVFVIRPPFLGVLSSVFFSSYPRHPFLSFLAFESNDFTPSIPRCPVLSFPAFPFLNPGSEIIIILQQLKILLKWHIIPIIICLSHFSRNILYSVLFGPCHVSEHNCRNLQYLRAAIS